MATDKKIKILVLGGTKFIGKSLVNKFDKKNFSVDIISRRKIKIKNVNNFYNIDLKKIRDYSLKTKYDYIFDFISKDQKVLYEFLEKISFKKYIFISTVWLVKLNKKIRLNKPITQKLNLKTNMNNITKNYLLNKYKLERFIYKKSKIQKNKKFYILRLPIILGNDDKTERLNYYFNRAKSLNNQIYIKNEKIYLNLLWVEDICLSLLKLIKKNIWPKNIFLEALNLNKISYNDFILTINNRLGLKKTNILKFDKVFFKKNLKSIFFNDPFINEIELKITNSNIFKIAKYKPQTFKKFIWKI